MEDGLGLVFGGMLLTLLALADPFCLSSGGHNDFIMSTFDILSPPV